MHRLNDLGRVVVVALCTLIIVALSAARSDAQSDSASDPRARAEAQVKATAQQLSADKDLNSAMQGFTRAHEIDPSDPNPLIYMGAIAFRQQDWPAAVKAYEAYLKLVPAGDEAEQAKQKMEEAKTFQAIGTSAPKTGAPSAVAIIDLDRTARDLGWQTAFQASSNSYQKQLKDDFQKFQQRYEAELQLHMKDMVPPGTREGEKYTLSQAQSQELSNEVSTARQQVQELNKEAQQLYADYRTQWLRQIREALAPIVREVAQQKHVQVVLVLGDNLMYADQMIDLTDQVVDAARQNPPALVEVPMERLKGPPDIQMNKVPKTGTEPEPRFPETTPKP